MPEWGRGSECAWCGLGPPQCRCEERDQRFELRGEVDCGICGEFVHMSDTVLDVECGSCCRKHYSEEELAGPTALAPILQMRRPE